MTHSSSLSRRLRYLTRDMVRSEPWRHRTRVMVWIVLLAAIVLEGVLILQPSQSSHNVASSPGIRAAQTTKAPVATVLPAASPASTLVPATAAEQAAFKAGQLSCQKGPATTLAPAGAGEHAAFEAGYQWCHSLSTVGHHGSGTKR